MKKIETYTVLSVCGSGIATSSLVGERLKEGLRKHGITSLRIIECSVSEASGLIENNPPDVIIYTTSLSSVNLRGIKSFPGLPILINLNTDTLYQEIADYLKESKNK